jgi:outer membrane protein assembly factor BamA
MTIYASIKDPSQVTAVLRFGAGKIFSKNYEYFQALSLGAQNYARGFRKNRFSGDGMLYSSAEVRFKLFKSRSFLLPGDVGIMGFYDLGRVWLANEHSKKWHNSYGGGIYFIPYSVVMVSVAMGISDEDQLLNFTVGTKFNLTF